MKREVSASYTVEASFVMTVAFFFIAALLNGVFEVHGRITGRFVLQEAMERCLYREEKTLRGDGMTVGEISSRAGQRLRGFFRCGDAVLTIWEDGGDLDGRVKSSDGDIPARTGAGAGAPFADSVGKCRVMEDTGWRFGIAGK
jgi:hypothetical protein